MSPPVVAARPLIRNEGRAATPVSIPRTRQLAVIGISHRRAGVGWRERFHLDAETVQPIELRLAGLEHEVLVLCTCNRIEIYLAAEDADAAIEHGCEALARVADATRAEIAPLLECRVDADAAHHLFRVAAGLDSLVPGESQILGQLRRAYSRALAAGTTGPTLNRLLQGALHVGKRARTETAIGRYPTSVASAAVELARRNLNGLAGRRILLLGAGETNRLTAASLAAHGLGAITVASRSISAAAALARSAGGIAVDIADLDAALGRADVVIAATSSSRPILTASRVAQAMVARNNQPMLLIDIAVPRDLDPEIRNVGGCRLLDLDDLHAVVSESLTSRRREAAKVETIVAEALADYRRLDRARAANPAIASLRQQADEIRTAALAKAAPRLSGLTPEQRAAVEMLATQLVSQLIHPTISYLKASA